MKFSIKKAQETWVDGIGLYVPGRMVPGYVKLASNENNYGPSPEVKEAICRSAEKVKTYPYRSEEVRDAVAKYVGLRRENILLGNGSDESIDVVYRAFKGPIASLNPSYGEYKIFSQALGKKYFTSNLAKDFSFDAGKFLKETKKANILTICSPNNPTGGVIPEGDVIRVLEEGKVTVIDEAYVEFYGKSITRLVNDYPNLVVLRTFSKAFALAGLRIGYLVSNPGIVDVLGKVKPSLSVNSVAMDAALAALGDIGYMHECVEKIKESRERLCAEINKKFTAYPTQANFILFNVAPMQSKEVYQKFFEEKIILRNFGKLRGFEGEYLRASVGTEEENKKFIEALRKI